MSQYSDRYGRESKRFTVKRGAAASWDEIAAEMGITRQHACMLYKQAMFKMRSNPQAAKVLSATLEFARAEHAIGVRSAMARIGDDSEDSYEL